MGVPLRLFVFGCCLAYGLSPDNARDIALEAGTEFGKRAVDAESDLELTAWLATRLGKVYTEHTNPE